MVESGAAQRYPTSGRRRRRRWALAAVVAVLAVVLVGGYAAASWVLYDGLSAAAGGCNPLDDANTPQAYSTRNPAFQTVADANAMPAPQEVVLTSRDPSSPEVRLAGWWIPADAATPADAPAVVVVHGIKSCRREANVLVPAGMLHRAGFSVLLMDLRDHGDSGGDADHRFAAGMDEHLDVLGAWDWLRSQGIPAERIGIAGISFGSIVSTIAGGEEPAVAAVWADSIGTRMDLALGNFVVDQLKDPTGLSRVLVPGALVWARALSGDDLVRYSPIDELRAYAGRPIAFVQGELDAVLPPAMAREMHDAAVAAGALTPEPWIVPNAKHSEAVFNDPAGYESRLVAFFRAAIGTP